jgi:hypothetical protein
VLASKAVELGEGVPFFCLNKNWSVKMRNVIAYGAVKPIRDRVPQEKFQDRVGEEGGFDAAW